MGNRPDEDHPCSRRRPAGLGFGLRPGPDGPPGSSQRSSLRHGHQDGVRDHRWHPLQALGRPRWSLRFRRLFVPTILIPSNIPLYGGKGLTVAFTESMVTHLQNFPAPPGPTDPFWLLCFLWHSGLFAVMMFGSIGWNMNPKLGGKQM